MIIISAVRFAIISFEGDKKNKFSAMSAKLDNSDLGIKIGNCSFMPDKDIISSLVNGPKIEITSGFEDKLFIIPIVLTTSPLVSKTKKRIDLSISDWVKNSLRPKR